MLQVIERSSAQDKERCRPVNHANAGRHLDSEDKSNLRPTGKNGSSLDRLFVFVFVGALIGTEHTRHTHKGSIQCYQ